MTNPSIRRFMIVLLLLLGPLTQFQTLYACELMAHEHENERPSMVCCCDEPGMMSQDQTIMASDGCEVTYEPSQVTQASGASTQSQQVLLLDAAQPPPLLVSYSFPEILHASRDIYFTPDYFVPLPDKPVYLLTRRFRI